MSCKGKPPMSSPKPNGLTNKTPSYGSTMSSGQFIKEFLLNQGGSNKAYSSTPKGSTQSRGGDSASKREKGAQRSYHSKSNNQSDMPMNLFQTHGPSLYNYSSRSGSRNGKYITSFFDDKRRSIEKATFGSKSPSSSAAPAKETVPKPFSLCTFTQHLAASRNAEHKTNTSSKGQRLHHNSGHNIGKPPVHHTTNTLDDLPPQQGKPFIELAKTPQNGSKASYFNSKHSEKKVTSPVSSSLEFNQMTTSSGGSRPPKKYPPGNLGSFTPSSLSTNLARFFKKSGPYAADSFSPHEVLHPLTRSVKSQSKERRNDSLKKSGKDANQRPMTTTGVYSTSDYHRGTPSTSKYSSGNPLNSEFCKGNSSSAKKSMSAKPPQVQLSIETGDVVAVTQVATATPIDTIQSYPNTAKQRHETEGGHELDDRQNIPVEYSTPVEGHDIENQHDPGYLSVQDKENLKHGGNSPPKASLKNFVAKLNEGEIFASNVNVDNLKPSAESLEGPHKNIRTNYGNENSGSKVASPDSKANGSLVRTPKGSRYKPPKTTKNSGFISSSGNMFSSGTRSPYSSYTTSFMSKNFSRPPTSSSSARRPNSGKKSNFHRPPSREQLELPVNLPPFESLYYVGSLERYYRNANDDDYFNHLFREHFTQTCQAMTFCKMLKPVDPRVLQQKRVFLPKRESHKDKKTIVFDLDETLIHCNESTEVPYDVVVPIKFPHGEVIEAGINVRPYAVEILKELSKDFEIIVFTASHACYANVVLDYLDPEYEYVHHRLFRERCVQTEEGIYIKDLRILGNRDLKDVVIVDNAAYSFGYQIDNGIPIVPFYNNHEDVELKILCDYLKLFANVRDGRDINRHVFKLGALQEFDAPDQAFEQLYEQQPQTVVTNAN